MKTIGRERRSAVHGVRPMRIATIERATRIGYTSVFSTGTCFALACAAISATSISAAQRGFASTRRRSYTAR